jgi:hypothetical protein
MTTSGKSDPTYLGDGVFANQERGMIKLTASNGVRDTDMIYLEDFVVAAFIKYLLDIGWLSFPQPKVENSVR